MYPESSATSTSARIKKPKKSTIEANASSTTLEPETESTQKAIEIKGPRDARLVTDRRKPRLRASYILVRTAAVALNPTDWKHVDFRATAGALSGCDYAGVVEAVGPDVTRPFAPGDRVCGMCHGANRLQLEDGAFAEYIVAKGDIQMRVPARMAFEEAATLGVGVVTVGQALYQSLRLPLPSSSSSSAPAETAVPLLIYGGSTATGTLAIQFAKLCVFFIPFFFQLDSPPSLFLDHLRPSFFKF